MNILRTVILASLVLAAAPATAAGTYNSNHTWGTKAQIEAINQGIRERVERDESEIAALKARWQRVGFQGHEQSNSAEEKH